MAKENIIITATKSGKTIQKSLTDMNPEATNAQLATFGTMLNALTTNTYQKTDRITKVNCDTEPGGGVKPTPTITLSFTSVDKSELPAVGQAPKDLVVTTNSNGTIYFRYANGTRWNYQPVIFRKTATTFAMNYGDITGHLEPSQVVYFCVTETESWAAAQAELTVTDVSNNT